ncbi:hypothetical protein [Winogradskyella sp. MIT101101]|uniref:hypothetical protein n=1 Tax=Winogradskyella sp. MIT101101 TaxID=3098297 RepID=UPI00399B8768
MKNKAKTYLLLAAVLGVWGTIAYKIVNGLSPEEPEIAEQNFDVAFNPKQQNALDTFSIKDVDRDPFLGTLSTRKQTSGKKVKSIKEQQKPLPQLNITYGGLIQNQNSKSKVFVVNINNQQYLLKPGQTVNNVKLISGDKQSIIIRYDGKNQTIKL